MRRVRHCRARRTAGGSKVRIEPQGAGARPDTSSGHADLVFTARARWSVVVVAAVLGAAIVAAAPLVPDTTDGYLVALVGAAAPFATAGLWFVHVARRDGAPAYRPFWRRWFAAAAIAYAAGTAALAGVVTRVGALLVLAIVLLVAAVPFWVASAIGMLRVQAGRRTISVDLLDAAGALAVLGAPAVLFGAEPMLRADHPAFVLPFLASVALMPAGLYLSVMSLALVPRGDRATQGIGLALGAAFAVNGGVQLAHVLSDFTSGMRLVLLCQVLNMGLLMAVPLWAHRTPTSALAGLPPEAQVRHADPLSYVSAAVLPLLAAAAWFTRESRPWGPAFVLAVLVVVVLLGAIRHAAQARETRRLHAEIERVAEERRRLLADMVRALEDDRANVAAELHVQAVESFAALGSLVQTAYVTLPPDSALVVKEAISHLQHDLSTRADALRRLTAALRPPAFDRPGSGTGDDAAVLATALQAFAVDAAGARDMVVRIAVDPDLRLDWSTTTIAYRLAQEALANAATHSSASTIEVDVRAEGATVVVQVTDDGVGFDVADVADVAAGADGASSPGLTRLRLLAELGGGRVDIARAPDGGTVVRGVLGVLGGPATDGPAATSRGRAAPPADGGAAGTPAAHLRLVTPDPRRARDADLPAP